MASLLVHHAASRPPDAQVWPQAVLEEPHSGTIGTIHMVKISSARSKYPFTIRCLLLLLLLFLSSIVHQPSLGRHLSAVYGMPINVLEMFTASVKLTQLHVHCSPKINVRARSAYYVKMREVSLAPLRRLPLLEVFVMGPERFMPSKQQTEDLVHCSNLRFFFFGNWFGRDGRDDNAGRSRSDYLSEGLGRLHELRQLEQISWNKNHVIDGEVWRHLSKCTSLTTLEPVKWSADIGSEGWVQLANMIHLKKFHYQPQYDDEPAASFPPAMWSSLMKLPAIETLSLDHVRLDATSMSQLFASLPNLRRLVMQDVAVESPALFAEAKALEHLTADYCTDFHNRIILWYDALPRMPLVESCQITESDRYLDGSAGKAADYRDKLMPKFPKANSEWIRIFIDHAEDNELPM